MVLSVAITDELTPRQREAVAHRGANLLLEAVPGSGKTRVIAARCMALLAEGIAASEILLLTFSRRAAGELRDRLARALPHAALPEIRTFHGFAAQLLAETGTAGHSRRLLSEPAQRAMLEYAIGSTTLASLPADVRRSSLFREAAGARIADLRRSAPAALAQLAQRATPRIADLLQLAQAQTRLRDGLGVADYDDLVACALELASTPDSALARALRGRYRHVLVDEFQDTDAQQLALVERLGGEVFAVGDSAQAIYGFRGAARDALMRARTALTMTTLPLDESFRCPAAVCELARGVWPSRPALHSGTGRAGDVSFQRASSPRDEAAHIGELIADAVDDGTPEREIAVLVRSAEPLARLVEQELRSRGVAVARRGGENVLDDLAVDAICAALSALADPADHAGWNRVFAHPVHGIAPLALRLELDTAPLRSFDDACRFAEGLGARSRVSGARLAGALRSAREAWDGGDPLRSARSFAAEADVLGFVVAASEPEVQRSSRRITQFLEALGDVRDVRTRLGLDAGSSAVFNDFLACSESWSADTEAIDNEPGVRVLTVHAAKGLEFDFVVIADAVDGRFPQEWRPDALLSEAEIADARSCGVDLATRTAEHDEEERALWYVAVTRSKNRLRICWSETDVAGSPQRPSRFIPLEARTRALHEPSFAAPLAYAPAPELKGLQPPGIASLTRPVRTSSIEMWLACRRKFYYGALLRIGSDERGFKPKLGSLVHAAIQAFHTTVRDFRTVAQGAHEAWATQLRDHAREAVSAAANVAFDSPLETDAALRAADRMLDRYARELETVARRTAGGFEVVASEEPVRYDCAGVAFAGKIDRIDRRVDGSLVLVDVKTGAFQKKKAMVTAFSKLAGVVTAGELWVKTTPPANPQLALYRHARTGTRALAYLYLESRPKFSDFSDAAHADELDLVADADVLGALDNALVETFFVPWTSGAITDVEPTRNAQACRFCEFVTVCPGYLEDED
jgi:DNA helicase-2/ATP-dependent DNA helicase PcrA